MQQFIIVLELSLLLGLFVQELIDAVVFKVDPEDVGEWIDD